MIKVWRWLKRWWWTIVVGAATVAGFVFWLLLPKPKRDSTPGQPPPKTFKERAQEQVERVQLEGEIEKARVAAKAEAQNEQLDNIEVIGQEDPAEARRQLASWLTQNL